MQPAYSLRTSMIVAALLSGCAGVPPAKEVTTAERVKYENAIGTEVSHQFESQLSFKKDTEVGIYLREIAERLATVSPELQMSSIGVLIAQDREQSWRNFSLPGNRIYFSVGLLRKLQFENEIAAVIAMELGHLLNRHVLERLDKYKQGHTREFGADPQEFNYSKLTATDYFGEGGIFAFSEDAKIAAAEAAVGILYRAGFDPRGLAAIWKIYEKNIERSPYERSTLNKLLESTRRAIAQSAPLRNPVVRSQAFLAIQKRIQRL